jgi:hypothetical protein
MKRITRRGKDGKIYIINVPDHDDRLLLSDIFGAAGNSVSQGGPSGGSFTFGAANQYLSISGSTDFVLSTGSFTVEWFQYAIEGPTNDRVFTQGVWPTAEFGVSIENFSGVIRMFLWLDGLGNVDAIANSGSVNLPYLNTWHHFAVVRNSGSYIQLFQDGAAIRTTTSATYVNANISSSLPIIIGGEGDNVVATMFSGSITNFRLVKGYALYSQSYSVPTSPLTTIPGTVLLLPATDTTSMFTDYSGLGKTVVGNSVSWSVAAPF